MVKYKRHFNKITDIRLNHRQEKNNMNKGFKMFAVMALLICAMFITPLKVEAKTVQFTDGLAKDIEKAVNKYNVVTMEQVSNFDAGGMKSKSNIKYKFNIKKQIVTMKFYAESTLKNTKTIQSYIITKNVKTGKVTYKEKGNTIPLTENTVKLITNSIKTGAYNKNGTKGTSASGKLTFKSAKKIQKVVINTVHYINDKKKLPEKVYIKIEGMDIYVKNIKFSK